MPRLMLILLCSGFFQLTCATRRLRYFFDIKDKKCNWTDAVKYCENNHNKASLVTVYDEEDARFIGSYTKDYLNNGNNIWLGLYNPNKNCKNAPFDQPKCKEITNQKLNWSDCSQEKSFKCNNSNEVYNIKKNWCQARQHCRQHLKDGLASEETSTNRQDPSFWIIDLKDEQLYQDEWSWQDKGCSSFRKWLPTGEGCSDENNCTRVGEGGVGLSDYGCTNEEYPFCSSGSVRIKVITKKASWEEAYNYCKEHHTRLLWIRDDRDQEAVVQWLDHTDPAGDRFWIGLRQSRVFGFWIWSSDTTVGESYSPSNWKNGETPQLPLSHHCGLIHKDDKKWEDEDCAWPLPFLCEEEIEYMDT